MFNWITREFRRVFGKDPYYRTIRSLLGFTPDNAELYKVAFIHRSASVVLPNGSAVNNERLEFLGDAVLEAIVSDYLFIAYPEHTEGFLTQIRSRIVSRASLDDIARRMGFEAHIVANFPDPAMYRHLYGNALEAIVGAMYLDKGYEFTNRFVIDRVLRHYVDMEDLSHTETDFKSRLIEWCQKSKRTIRFQTTQDSEATRQPQFLSKVIIDGIELGHGRGGSKKEAEQKAAWAVSQIVGNADIGDYFMETVDMTLERYKATAADGQVN